MNKSTLSSPEPSRGSLSQQRWLMALPIVAGVVLLLVAVLLVIILGIRSMFPPSEGDPGVSLIVTKIPVSPGAPTPAPTAAPGEVSSCEAIISSGDVAIVASAPLSLTIGGESFPVEVVKAEEGWAYPAGSSGQAAWVCGTVVNYVVVLEPIAENETLLAGLVVGDEVKLRLSNGVELFFGFEQQREAKTDEMGSFFEQFEPRLTVLLEQDGNAWLVSTASYVTRVEPVPSSLPDTLARPNVPVRVGGAQVMVLKGYALRSAPDLPAGTMYYLVEFTITNVGEAPLNADLFTMQLQDNLGNRYLVSSAATAFGDSGLIEGEIAAGETVEGSAGYLVPQMLAGPTLVWTLSPAPGSEVWASVAISYEGEPGPAEPARAEVTITDALLNSDKSTLIIEGEIRNVGGSPLTLDVRDIILSSSAGMGELLTAAPPLPWTIEPAQTRVIELQFEKPDAASVLLTLLGYSFEISGLE